jgi:hypothetical protein
VDRASPARFPRVRHDVVQSNTNHITVCVIFYLVCLYGFTSNTYYAFDSTYTSCIAFYVTQRLFGATWYLAVGIILRQVRGAMIMTSITTLITAAIWIASIHVPWPGQLAPIVIAILLDLFGNVFLIWTMKAAAKRKLPEAFASWFEFFPAINIEHRVERNNAFVSLVGQYTADFSSHADVFIFRSLDTLSSRSCSSRDPLLASTHSLAREFSDSSKLSCSIGICSRGILGKVSF